MRKHVLPRLKSLLAAACATLYTRQTQPAKRKFSLEPEPEHCDQGDDAWLFAPHSPVDDVRSVLSQQMNGLADSLTDLRETLALINGETPFPIEATTLAPCAILHHDDALFDGEAEAPFLPAQEEISGGENLFLFGDTPSFEDNISTQHLYAA
jgi:hypothetical protein